MKGNLFARAAVAVVVIAMGAVQMARAQDVTPPCPGTGVFPAVLSATGSIIKLAVPSCTDDVTPPDSLVYHVWVESTPNVSTSTRASDKQFTNPPKRTDGRRVLQISNLPPGALFFFRVRVADQAGNMSADLADNEIYGSTLARAIMRNVTQAEADYIFLTLNKRWYRQIDGGRSVGTVQNTLVYAVESYSGGPGGSWTAFGKLSSWWRIQHTEKGPWDESGNDRMFSMEKIVKAAYTPAVGTTSSKLSVEIQDAPIRSPDHSTYGAATKALVHYDKTLTKTVKIGFSAQDNFKGLEFGASATQSGAVNLQTVEVYFWGLPYQIWTTVGLRRNGSVELKCGYNWLSTFFLDTISKAITTDQGSTWHEEWSAKLGVIIVPIGGYPIPIPNKFDFDSTSGETEVTNVKAEDVHATVVANWPANCPLPDCFPTRYDGEGDWIAWMKIDTGKQAGPCPFPDSRQDVVWSFRADAVDTTLETTIGQNQETTSCMTQF